MAKILFVSGWYPTDDRPSFGIFVRRHAEAAARNNEVSVLYVRTITSPGKKSIEIEAGTKNNLFEVIVSINKRKLGFPPVSALLKFIFYIRALIKGYKIIVIYKGKPDIVHANILYEGGRQALLLKLLYGIPFVCTEHWTGYLPEDGTYSGFIKTSISKLVASKAKYILPITKQLSAAMQSHRLKGNYLVIPNVVNTDAFFPEVNARRNLNRIIHISSLDERQKNLDGILKAFKIASDKITALEMVVVGGVENLESARQMVVKNNLSPEKISFTGYIDENKIAMLLRESLCHVLFSNYETQGCVVLESIACGTPVIVSDLEVHRDVVNENNGILVEAGNENGLAAAMQKMYHESGNYSPEKLSEFIRQNYSYEKVNRMLNDVYQESMKRN
ncbi:MAG TPA: glycosyltransferase family 4 protein [Bacteroidia bacterium]|nr:glycosyltransferase family 4 protein [Bacteroidia bacterium]